MDLEDGVYLADGRTFISIKGVCYVPHPETKSGLHEYPKDLVCIFINRAVALVHIPASSIDVLRRKS